MSKLVEQISTMNAFHSLGASTPGQVDAAEQALGLTFSREYREYLLAFGAASVYGHELTGICDDKRLNVVDVTNDQRDFSAPVPSGWYVIEELNVDDMVAWQDATGLVFLTQPGTRPTLTAFSLLEYLQQGQDVSHR